MYQFGLQLWTHTQLMGGGREIPPFSRSTFAPMPILEFYFLSSSSNIDRILNAI
jgi:hypothetical protein